MTREEIWSNIEKLSELRSKYSCFDEKEEPFYHALSLGIKALEQEPITDRIEYGTDGNSYKLTISNGKEFKQEPILDKISSEVEQYNLRPSNYPCNMISIGTVLQIIDKYRGEEDEDSN